ncbi:MAG: BrnA antitoxin family protein [Bryobacterales bacterium]|nr:BrnA antitoxin family protein [Bryobacterales bacterium]
MTKRKLEKIRIPKFEDEKEEAKWWASAKGRAFLKKQPMAKTPDRRKGSALVAKLARADSVQIALRLPAPDLAKAREMAERKGLGYQTFLKMLIHEGLERQG